jgi:predicted metal-dependent phosphoesterase TrpH
MPAGQPFTQLCRALARFRPGSRVDLHMHTTCSDGLYTPEQIVDLARRSGMPAIAITDHDTIAALEPARRHAGTRLQVIAGVELSTEFQGHELHLLAYFFDPRHAGLNAALERLRGGRRRRFFAMADRLSDLGVRLSESGLQQAATCGAVGRRHLAQLLVDERKTETMREAFVRYLGDFGEAAVPKERIAVAEAIALVNDAGGVSAWAHPGEECTWESLRGLYNLGMRAVEVDWPTARVTRSRVLRQWAKTLGMAVTAGSDCHGPDEPKRALGARGVDLDELERLQQMTSVRDSV